MALTVLKLKRLPAGVHQDGTVPGLHLRVSESGRKRWALRITIEGKRRDIGLGGYPDVGLAQARKLAQDMRSQVAEGVDPLAERRKAEPVPQSHTTFRETAEKVIARKEAEATNPKHAKQWRSTLETYAYPVMGDKPVGDIDLDDVLRVLEPIWETKTETATRVRQRVEAVLALASATGHRSAANVATWRGNLEAILPTPSKIAKLKHHRALPFEELPGFMQDLRKRNGIAARALELTILTAARSGEVRGATWDEIDLERGLWVVPSERMKARAEHRIPLSGAAVELLEATPRFLDSELVFPSSQTGNALSDMTLAAVLKRMGVSDRATVHGFRSTFRDWAAECTHFPNIVAEQALAHTVKGVEGAYRRGDLLEKRRDLMEEWAEFCTKLA